MTDVSMPMHSAADKECTTNGYNQVLLYMEEYPLQIRDAVSLLKRMQTNSQEMSMWKNLRLAREVLRLLDSISARGESHTPYDKIFLLDILCDNLSNRDLPRFTIGVLERMR